MCQRQLHTDVRLDTWEPKLSSVCSRTAPKAGDQMQPIVTCAFLHQCNTVVLVLAAPGAQCQSFLHATSRMSGTVSLLVAAELLMRLAPGRLGDHRRFHHRPHGTVVRGRGSSRERRGRRGAR